MTDVERALRQLVALEDEWVEHHGECQACPCEKCEDWYDRQSVALSEARQIVRLIDGSGSGHE